MAEPHTAAFLVSDIESSTILWEAAPIEMLDDVADHDRILRDAIAVNLGWTFCEAGDSFAVLFPIAADALAAAVAAQQALQRHPWRVGRGIKVRMGLHAGPIFRRDGKLFGAPISLCSRLCAAGDGGQVLLTGAFLDALDRIPSGCRLVEVGEYLLRSAAHSEHIYRIEGAGLESNGNRLRGSEAWELPAEPNQRTKSAVKPLVLTHG